MSEKNTKFKCPKKELTRQKTATSCSSVVVRGPHREIVKSCQFSFWYSGCTARTGGFWFGFNSLGFHRLHFLWLISVGGVRAKFVIYQWNIYFFSSFCSFFSSKFCFKFWGFFSIRLFNWTGFFNIFFWF